jgi:hypothetical protein
MIQAKRWLMLKFYFSGAPNPTKVALFLEEAGLPYEAIPVDTRRGEPVSGRFEVSEGLITVTPPDGRKTTADIEESMLSLEILARVLLLQMHRAKQPNATSEDLLGD